MVIPSVADIERCSSLHDATGVVNGRRELRIIVRSDCYRIDGRYLYLPKGLKLRY